MCMLLSDNKFLIGPGLWLCSGTESMTGDDRDIGSEFSRLRLSTSFSVVLLYSALSEHFAILCVEID